MTEQHYLEAELTDLLHTDPQMWTFLQRGSLDGIWYWDLEHPDREWMSPEFWRVFGIDPATKAHDPAEWQDIIFPDDLAVALDNFTRHCADPECPYDQVVRYRHADGSTVWVRCRGLAIRDETGKPVRMLGAHNDLTAIKQAEERAQAGWRAAETSNAELKSFAYAISHDLKAPSNTLDLLLTEIADHAPEAMGDDTRHLLDLSRQTVARMQSVIENVLDYTRVVGMAPDFQRLSLGEVVRQALADLRADLDAAGAVVTIGKMPDIMGIETQVHLLIQNLVANAIKFRRPDVPPTVLISCVTNPLKRAHMLIIGDNGIGIAKEAADQIFTMFQRLHNREEYEGTGIGLPLCQRIAANHGGEITVASEVGSGSQFIVSFPWESR